MPGVEVCACHAHDMSLVIDLVVALVALCLRPAIVFLQVAVTLVLIGARGSVSLVRLLFSAV